MSDWSEQALCKGMDSKIFFPEMSDRETNLVNLKKAMNICKRCPVMIECFMHSINNSEPDGIWGGVPFRQRTKIQRRYGVPIEPDLAAKVLEDYGYKV